MEEKNQKKEKKLIGKIVDAVIISVASGSVLTLFTLLFVFGIEIRNELKQIDDKAGINLTKIDAGQETIISSLSKIEANQDMYEHKLEENKEEIDRLKKKIWELEKVKNPNLKPPKKEEPKKEPKKEPKIDTKQRQKSYREKIERGFDQRQQQKRAWDKYFKK